MGKEKKERKKVEKNLIPKHLKIKEKIKDMQIEGQKYTSTENDELEHLKKLEDFFNSSPSPSSDITINQIALLNDPKLDKMKSPENLDILEDLFNLSQNPSHNPMINQMDLLNDQKFDEMKSSENLDDLEDLFNLSQSPSKEDFFALENFLNNSEDLDPEKTLIHEQHSDSLCSKKLSSQELKAKIEENSLKRLEKETSLKNIESKNLLSPF